MITLSGFRCTTVITDLLLSLVIVFETKYVKNLFLELQTKMQLKNVLILKEEGRKEKKDLRKKKKKRKKDLILHLLFVLNLKIFIDSFVGRLVWI